MHRIVQKPKPLVLCILDGWGLAPDSDFNAITKAHPANFLALMYSFPHTSLTTAGTAVGLPHGQVGNSEVGHMNLGAGRIVYQDSLRIENSIADGSFFQNPALLKAVEHAKTNNSQLHIMGLLSTGIVHSHIDHLYALISLAQKNGLEGTRIKLHLFTDGRDSSPQASIPLIQALIEKAVTPKLAQIASIGGRYYAMDRDNRWDRTGKAYLALTGRSQSRKLDPLQAVEQSHKIGVGDEFIDPAVIVDQAGRPLGPISENDAVIFFNFRPDRARQLTKAFVLDSLANIKTSAGETAVIFDRGTKIKNLFFASLTQYEKDLPVSAVAFKPQEVLMPLARVFSERDAKQFHIAETEKYAHVTYFFNGRKETPFPGEDRILIPSPKIDSYDKMPEMSIAAVTKTVIEKINSRAYDFIVANFANPDMVAHTGNFEATVRAIKAVDFHLGIVAKSALAVGGGFILTADHGNAEQVGNIAGSVDTQHNLDPAPCIFAVKEFQGKPYQLPKGILADVAPTILSILNIPRPSEMTGANLLA